MTLPDDAWIARRYGGAITHVALDYGLTLTSCGDPVDPVLGMRPVAEAARAAVRELHAAGLVLALVSNTVPGQDRRRALKAAGLDELFADRVYLSHELGLDKTHPGFYPYVLDELDVAPSALLVCGNNIDTDVRAPALLGIRAVLLGPLAAPAHLPPRARLIARIGDLPRILTGELRAYA
ncbi:HAD family hydrolase [Actinomadura sp. NPDC023710]|uniref:HAD family hydrolase n=1 Tax=Actinomadura sp. NPDC023710 TaxID=3158219 RepID=UPI0033DD2873